MNIIFSFIPIILLIMIVGLVVVLIRLNTIKKKTYLSGQKIRWIFGVYVTVLLISVGLFYLIPTEAESTIDTKTDLGFAYLSEKIYNGSVSDLDEKFISKQWDFDYEGEKLNMEAANNDVNGISIFLERKEDNDNRIDVTFYQTPSYVEGIDVTDKIKPPYNKRCISGGKIKRFYVFT